MLPECLPPSLNVNFSSFAVISNTERLSNYICRFARFTLCRERQA
jgi:hypothetical protein